jgi:transketolase
MEIVTGPHARNFVAWSADKPKVVVLSADLTNSCEVGVWSKTYPERFFSFGLAEQNMMSWAAGLARRGFFPYLHTFAVFLYRRPYDQLAMSVAYPNLPVRLIGFLPGIISPGGASHQAIEDIAVMRATPNMTVVDMGDATDVETCLDEIQAVNGPVYVRMLRGEVPRLFDASEPFVLNQARVLSTGTDLAILSSGICTEEAMRATSVLRDRGVSIAHLHVSTLKPFTDPQVVEAIAEARQGVITMENHSIVGGLGSAVAELMAESGAGRKLLRIGIQDRYSHGATRHTLMKENELDALSLVHGVERLTGPQLGITEDDLAAVRIDAVHSEAKAEAL